jgi:hypothetical protein
MLELQENIAKARSATVKPCRKAVDRAVREYFSALEPIRNPSVGDFEAAAARAQAVLKEEMLAAPFISLVSGTSNLDESEMARVALQFEALARPLRIPGPAALTESKTLTLAVAGAAGAVGGMFALAPLTRLALDMRDLGLVLGAPLGALLAVLIVHRLARIRLLARALPWLFIPRKSLHGVVRSEHEKAVRMCLEQWADWAVPMLAALCLHKSGVTESGTDRDKALRRIGKLIYALHRTNSESLPVEAHELIQEAKNSGFEGLEGPPAFVDEAHMENPTLTWKPDFQSKYETFGHIVEGDQVRVERQAVILGGRVVQRGLVRKVRERT